MLLSYAALILALILALLTDMCACTQMSNLWTDLRMTGMSNKRKKIIDKSRAKLIEGETRKLTKWEQLEKQVLAGFTLTHSLTLTHTYTHTHTDTHTCIHAYIPARIHTYIHA